MEFFGVKSSGDQITELLTKNRIINSNPNDPLDPFSRLNATKALNRIGNSNQPSTTITEPPPPVRQFDVRPPAETVESLGKVSWNSGIFKGGRGETDFTRATGSAPVTVVFPENLHSGVFPHIRFNVYEINSNSLDGTNTSTVQNRSSASITAGITNVISAGSNLVQSAAGSAGDLIKNYTPDTVKRFATAATAVAGPALEGAATGTAEALNQSFNPQQFKEKVSSLFKDFSLNRYSSTPVISLCLPIPEGLATQYSQNYGEVSLSKAFGVVGFGAQALAEPKFLDKNDPYIAEMSTRAASKLFNTSEDITNILQFGLSGRVVNPQMEMLYQSPNYREFVFDFRLVPRNAQDSNRIYEIIRYFKYFSSPTFCGATTGRYYLPPAKFEFTIMRNQSDANEFFFRSKQCVVTNVAVDYAPNGYATHEEGAPVEVRLSVSLKETAMITAADLDPAEGGMDY